MNSNTVAGKYTIYIYDAIWYQSYVLRVDFCVLLLLLLLF
jgi:hypothetical protein